MRKEIVWGSVIKTVFAMCAVMVFFGPAGTLKVSAKDVNVKNYGLPHFQLHRHIHLFH